MAAVQFRKTTRRYPGADHDVIVRADPRAVPATGERIHPRVRDGGQHVFSARTGQRVTA